MHLPLESTNFAYFSRADMILLDSWMQFKKCYVITRSINIWYRYTKIIKKSKFSVNKRTKGPMWFNSVYGGEKEEKFELHRSTSCTLFDHSIALTLNCCPKL